MINKVLAWPIKEGINISFRNKNYNLVYPEKIWKSYPNKNVLIRNLTPLATLSLPLMLNIKKVYYNAPKPFFQKQFKKLLLKDLPSSTYDNKQDAIKLAKKFLEIKYEFEQTKLKERNMKYNKPQKPRAIIPLSFGKDSLLSLAVSREIGLNPVSIYIDDTISPTENKLKLAQGKKLAKEFKQKHYVVINNIEKLNDFETWNKPETSFNYSHMATGFCFIALPFVYYHNAKYIILGNEQDMNFSFRSIQNTLTWPAYDQTSEWQQEQDKMIKKLTANKTGVTSVIRPLTNIAIVKILYSRYPNLAKYEVSCDCLDVSKEKRWCHTCNKCARLFLFMKAFGINTKKIGLRNMFKKKHKKLYCLFNGKEVDRYEKSQEAREQQLLAFLLAYRQKARGYLIELFKKKFFKEALAKEQELRKKYFKLWPAQMPRELKEVLSIYREELF